MSFYEFTMIKMWRHILIILNYFVSGVYLQKDDSTCKVPNDLIMQWTGSVWTNLLDIHSTNMKYPSNIISYKTSDTLGGANIDPRDLIWTICVEGL